jgi:hypothetical protein
MSIELSSIELRKQRKIKHFKEWIAQQMEDVKIKIPEHVLDILKERKNKFGSSCSRLGYNCRVVRYKIKGLPVPIITRTIKKYIILLYKLFLKKNGLVTVSYTFLIYSILKTLDLKDHLNFFNVNSVILDKYKHIDVSSFDKIKFFIPFMHKKFKAISKDIFRESLDSWT